MFTKLALPVLVLAALSSVSAAPSRLPAEKRTDDRLLVTKPGNETISQFYYRFTDECRNYPPLHQPGFYDELVANQFTNGDYQGNNKDTEALVACVYSSRNTPNIDVTAEVVQAVGGTVN